MIVSYRVTAVKKMNGLKLSEEDERFINRMIKLGQRNGLNLNSNVQDQIKVFLLLLIFYVTFIK